MLDLVSVSTVLGRHLMNHGNHVEPLITYPQGYRTVGASSERCAAEVVDPVDSIAAAANGLPFSNARNVSESPMRFGRVAATGVSCRA